MKESRLIRFIQSHDRAEHAVRQSRTAMLLGQTKSTTASLLVRILGANKLARNEKKISSYFVCAQTSAYGTLLLVFGLVTLLSHFARYYLETEVVDVFLPLILGAACCLFAIPLLVPEETLSELTEHNRVLNAIFYDFFCLKRTYVSAATVVFRRRVAIPLGILLGGLGFLTSPLYVLLSLIGLVLFRLSISSPELPFLLSLLALPYFSIIPHGTLILTALVTLATLSYLRKVALGNRIFALEGYDILLLLFALVYLISGIFNGGTVSFTSSLVRVLLLSGFTLASNLIANRRIADNAAAALGLTSVPVSLIGIYQYFFSDLNDTYSDPMFSDLIRGRVSGTFTNPNVFAMFLCVASIFALYRLQGARRTGERAVCAIILAIHLFATVLTFSRGAWIALALSILLVLLLEYVRTPGVLLTLLLFLTSLTAVLPQAVLTRLFSIVNTSDSSIQYRMSILRSSVAMFKDNLLVGIGVGEEAFRTAFTQYAEDAVTAPHSHNLLLQIGCEAGIVALLLFLILLLWRARHVTSYRRYTKVSSVRRANHCCIGVIFSLLLFGMTDSVFYPFPIYYLFFLVFGMGSAVLRIAKQESEDRQGYYGDDQMPDASSIEISVEKDR